jgi:hypothetical protein
MREETGEVGRKGGRGREKGKEKVRSLLPQE